MNICVPTLTKEGLHSQVHDHFGSAPFFTIYDTANGSVEIIVNANEHHAHGMCQPLKVLGPLAVGAVVCRGMGAGAVQKLNQGGIKVYRAIPGTVADVAAQLANGKLEEISVQNACLHHGCH